MPRIDPLQLLKCLSVLLSSDGGILSRDEVPRLVNLMTKFSKKLVSKCIYVLILKNTETSLVDMFMAEGGWALIQSWLQDGVQTGNWDLVKEILGLLLITPVDVERLKMNCLPKVIKSLSRREDLFEVADISNQIVQNWLTIVKGCSGMTASNGPTRLPPAHSDNRVPAQGGEEIKKPDVAVAAPETAGSVPVEERNGEADKTSVENVAPIQTTTFYKMSMKDGKQVIKKVTSEDSKNVSEDDESSKSDDSKTKTVEKDAKSSDKEKSSRSGSSSSKSKSSSSSRDKDRDKKSSSKSSSSSKNKSSSSSSSSSRDKDRKDREKDRDRKDRSKHSSSSSSKSSSRSSSSKDKKDSKDKSKEPKETKENQADKDKDTLDKIKPHTLDKLGRIPKKSTGSDEKQENKPNEESDKKRPSFSILNRKSTGEERSKTVKVFNAKMRSTGLEEEVKPPPPRSANKKPNPSVQLPTIPPKRPSPPRDFSSMPPEKKLKIDKVDIPDRPGAIKLIPPKPKPAILQESDMFMDALTAATPKKDTKKRKRRVSVSKETVPSSPSEAPAQGDGQAADPATPTSPIGLKNMAPINFYQDTLSEEPEAAEEKAEATEGDSVEASAEPSDPNETPSSPPNGSKSEAMEVDEASNAPRATTQEGGLKGVLLFAKKKGPKRSIKWKAEDELVEIRFFELDENERVNVTKTFMDMAKMEMTNERETLIMSRKLPNEDTMEPQIMWRMMFICDQPESLAIPGSKSLEKDIQFAREKTALPALYFDKRRIPDSAEEPIPEIHQMSDPVSIPLEDPECQEIDLRNTPWPEPKGFSPQMEPQIAPPIFQNIPFNPNFNNMGNLPPGAPFMGVPPRFQGPPGPMGPVPGNFVPPNMMHNNMMVPPMNQPDMMNSIPPGSMNQGMFGHAGMMKPGPDGFIGHGNSMPSFNGPQGPMFGPNNFNRGRGGFRRGGGNNGGWVQLNGPRAWKRGNSGNSRGGGRLCKNIQNHGYCRNGDNCPFVH